MTEAWSDQPTERLVQRPEKLEGNATEFPISSYELNQDEPHAIGKKEIGVEGFFLNTEHSQDAFAVRENAIVVCDGVSMEPHSGVFSSLLADTLAKEIALSGIRGAASEKLIKAVTQQTLRHPDVERSNRTGFASTFVALDVDKATKSIRFVSKGDSPLFVIDRKMDGTLPEFEIVNDEWMIDNETYLKLSNILHLKDNFADAVGISELGTNHLSLDGMKEGWIEYKQGRQVVVGSDFLTKMLLLSPEALEARILKEPDMGKKMDLEEHAPRCAPFKELWIQNPATGKMAFNPAFFMGKGKGELAILLNRWKEATWMGSDDATMIAIDMDTVFANKTA